MRSTKRKEERKRGIKTEARQRLTALTRSITFKHSHKSRRVWVLIVFKLPGHSGSYHWPFHSISVRNKMCSSTTLPPLPPLPPQPPILLPKHVKRLKDMKWNLWQKGTRVHRLFAALIKMEATLKKKINRKNWQGHKLVSKQSKTRRQKKKRAGIWPELFVLADRFKAALRRFSKKSRLLL